MANLVEESVADMLKKICEVIHLGDLDRAVLYEFLVELYTNGYVDGREEVKE
jgi:hypothetical protein